MEGPDRRPGPLKGGSTPGKGRAEPGKARPAGSPQPMFGLFLTSTAGRGKHRSVP